MYDYFELKRLRDEYSKVKTYDDESALKITIESFLTDPEDSKSFTVASRSVKTVNLVYGTTSRYPLDQVLRKGVACLDGILARQHKPIEIYSLDELKSKYYDVYRNRSVEVLSKENKSNVTLKNLNFIANRFGVRHVLTDSKKDELGRKVPDGLQKTLLREGIEIMLDDNKFLKDNYVFNTLSKAARNKMDS